MKNWLAVAALILCLGVGPAASQSDDLGLNKGWGKIRTVDDICAEDPKAVPCAMRDKSNPLFRPMSLGRVSGPAVLQQARPVPPRVSTGTVRRFAMPVALPAAGSRARFFHGGVAVAAGINLKAWRDSGQYGKLAGQLKSAGLAGGWDAFLPMVEDLDEAWIAIDSAGSQTQPVVLLMGKFTNPLWRKVLASNQPLGSANAVLVGQPAAVGASRRRLSVPAPASKLAFEAEQLSKENDIWLTGVPRLLPKGSQGANPAGAAMDSVQRFSFRMNIREKFTGDLSLQTATPEAAAGLLGLYRLMQAQSAAANPKEWEPFAKALTAESDASTVRLRFEIDPNELAPILALRAKAAAPPPVARRMITIQGLEDGPREIPLDARQ